MYTNGYIKVVPKMVPKVVPNALFEYKDGADEETFQLYSVYT